VAREVAAGDEIGKGELREQRDIAGQQGQRRGEGSDQAVGKDGVRQADAREHRLREGPRVDHHAIPVDALQRRQRAAVVSELAVVVVLEHPGGVPARPLQELHAPLKRERRAQGGLTRRGDEGQPRIGSRGDARIDVDSFSVDRDGHQVRARGTEDLAGAEVSRLLHPRGVALIEEQSGRDVEELLGAARDHHVVRGAGDAAVDAQVLGKGLAERSVSLRIDFAEPIRPGVAGVPGDEARPKLRREGIDGGHVGAERPWRGKRPDGEG